MADGDATVKEGNACVEEESEEEGEVLDLEGQGLTSINVPDNAHPQTLILNNNSLTKLDGVHVYSDLSQLSAVNNHIVRMTGLHTLTSLTVLSLSNNSIGAIEELECLSQLMWLDLSSNSIKVIENLPKGGQLHYLDLSDNDITHFSDLSTLSHLKTLLLHSNNISSLKTASCLPQSLGVLSLADNSISDLNEISYLSGLLHLQQLSLAENPCVLKTSEGKGFDYRPYVWNWCPSLHILDALVITDKERLLGEWLYSQGKGRQFHPGEHAQLVDYLVTTCPLNSTEQLGPEEDSKLSQILNQQRRYQQQLQQLSQQQVQSTGNLSPQETNSYFVHRTDPADLSVLSSSSNARTSCVNDLILQDLSYDGDARSSVSLLESESVYLPFDVPASPVVLCCSGTSPDKHQYISSKPSLGVTVAVARKHDRDIHQTRPFTHPSPSKHDSPEQRPILPLNQQIGKSFQRLSFHVARPVSSSSEPSISTPKDTSLVTALSQDYESGSEQTASESDSIPLDLIKVHVVQPPVNTIMDSSTKSAPADKLSHIRTVAGNKKSANHTTSVVTEKAKTATKVRSGTNLIMKSLFNTSSSARATDTASNIAASAVVRARILKGSSVPAESNSIMADIAEVNYNDQLRDITTLNSSDHAGISDSKLIKGQLNQERVDQTKNAASLRVNRAAAMIQACWRGYRTRHFNTQVVSVRKEIRARRAEDHIMLLRQDLERNRKLYEEEKQLRILQMEAIRLLYREVQELKSHSLASSKDLTSTDDCTSSASLTVRLSPAKTARSVASPSTASNSELDRTQELERACASLQGQVSQLQEALESVSSAVFKTNSSDSASFDISDQSDKISISPVLDSQFNKDHPSDEASQWGCIPHSLSPYPSEEEDLYYRQVSTQGAPTPPRHLQLRHYSHQALLLSWEVPCCGQSWEEEGNKHIIGYRVYMNDQLKAFICQRTCVLVEGLNPSAIYKFYVKALSGFGESFESNIIMAKLAKGQERPTFQANCESDSSQDSDKDVDFMENNEKQRYRMRKLRKSPRLAEKMKSTKMSVHHRRQKISSEIGEQTSEEMNISNNCLIDDTKCAILTHPKLHTHRRHRGKEHHSEELKHYTSETTSQESSPCAGTGVRVGDQKPEESNPQMSPKPPQLFSRSSSGRHSRKLLDFSKTEHRREEDISDVDRINKPSTNPSENIATHKKDSPSRVNESPPTGSRRQGSPSSYKRMETTGLPPQHTSPVCGTENENRQKVSPRSGTESSPLKISPSAGSSDKSGNMSSTLSDTFTVDKAHSYLESVSAIAQSVLGDRSVGKTGVQGHKRSRDQQQHGGKGSIDSKVTPELAQDCLSAEEAARLGIGKHREKPASSDSRDAHNGEAEGRERHDSAGKIKSHRRSYSKDFGLEIQDGSNIDGAGGGLEDNRTENEVNKYGDDSSKADNDTVKSGSINLSSQPVIDGRRRHSSGSRPNSPGISVGSGERPRLTVAELMMEQKLRVITKPISLNPSSARTDGGSRSESSRRSPSPNSSQGDTSHLFEDGCKGESSKRTHNTESLVNTVTETSKRSHSNESMPGSTRSETSRRSPSSESLPENIPMETETSTSQTKRNILDRSSVSEGQTSGCKRSWSTGSVNDLARKENRESQSSRANSLVSKLLLKLESITRNSSTSFRERSDAFKLKKSNSDDRDCDTGASKPPSDDERRSGPRSRNLSDSDIEVKTSDPGSQLPPRVPSDNSSGSHSDDNHHSSTRHRRTPSDHRPPDSSRPTHSPIIMEGAMIRKTSSSMRRNQSFHGLLPSKHQDTKTSPSSNEDIAPKTEDQTTNLPSSDSLAGPPSHMRSRTPSPRGRKPVLSAAQLKGLTESSKP